MESIYTDLALYGSTMSVLGLILSSNQYLRSALLRFPLSSINVYFLYFLYFLPSSIINHSSVNNFFTFCTFFHHPSSIIHQCIISVKLSELVKNGKSVFKKRSKTVKNSQKWEKKQSKLVKIGQK